VRVRRCGYASFSGFAFSNQTLPCTLACARGACLLTRPPCCCADAYVGQNTSAHSLETLVAQTRIADRVLRLRVRRDPRHPQQPDPQFAPDVADERWTSVLSDHRHGGGVGRGSLRREADACAIAIFKPQLRTTHSFAQLTPCLHSLTERVPYEGTSRMQTSLRRRQRDRVVRRSVPLPSNSGFNSQPLSKRASTDRVRSSVSEQWSGDDDRERFLRHRRRPPVRIPASNSTPSNAHSNQNAFLFSGTLPISSSPSGEIDDSNAETHLRLNRPLTLAHDLCRYCVQEVGTASDAVQPAQPPPQTPT